MAGQRVWCCQRSTVVVYVQLILSVRQFIHLPCSTPQRLKAAAAGAQSLHTKFAVTTSLSFVKRQQRSVTVIHLWKQQQLTLCVI